MSDELTEKARKIGARFVDGHIGINGLEQAIVSALREERERAGRLVQIEKDKLNRSAKAAPFGTTELGGILMALESLESVASAIRNRGEAE